jgi:hypothetical protein
MKFSDLSAYIRPEVQGCPDHLIERAVRDSCIDFCRRTDVYMPEPEAVTVVKGVNEYALSLPTGTELNHIIDIYNDTAPLKPVSYTKLLSILGNETEQGTPQYYAQRDNTDFYLAKIPNRDYSLKVVFSVKPSSTSTSIPDTVGKEYREILVHGALYRLQMMNQPWGNANLAGSNKQLFDREVGVTVRQVKYGFSGGSLTCRSRAFI